MKCRDYSLRGGLRFPSVGLTTGTEDLLLPFFLSDSDTYGCNIQPLEKL